MTEPITQESAYQACLDMAIKHNWCACYNAMEEDGFDPTVDWISMHAKWCAEESE
jgi:hypothetical protein